MINCLTCQNYNDRKCKTAMHSACSKYVLDPNGETELKTSSFLFEVGEPLPPVGEWSKNLFAINGQLKRIFVDIMTPMQWVSGRKLECIATYRYYVDEDVEIKIKGGRSNVVPFRKSGTD
jgi:hypothetical protein